MITDKKEFIKGTFLLTIFFAVLVLIFSPLYHGENGLIYLDKLYNSISKGSADYIPELRNQARQFSEEKVNITLTPDTSVDSNKIKQLLTESGVTITEQKGGLNVSGSLKKIILNCLDDAESMYNNHGIKVRKKYNCNEKEILFNWWVALNLMDKTLKKEKLFSEARFIMEVQKKAVETSYNYFGITPEKISEQFGVVFLSLVFYVVYTLLYGFAVMFIFTGWGMKLEE